MNRLLLPAGLSLLAAAAVSPSAAGARALSPSTHAPSPPSDVRAPAHLTARLDVKALGRVSTKAALRASAAGTGLQMWSRNQASGGTTYTYSMVGRNPFVIEKYPNTTVKTFVLALDIQNGSDDFNAYANDSCDPLDESAQTRFLASPILKNKAYTWGGTPIATTGVQITDAFQRAEFWKYTNPTTGVNPQYNVRLGWNATTQLQQFDAGNAGGWPEATGSCGNLLELDFSAYNGYFQSTVIPYAQSHGLTPSDLLIILVHNVVFTQNSGATCCILGYHSSFSSDGGTQTYAVADYDTTGIFPKNPDIAPASHEVAEWMNDPLGNNPTPAWGHIGQQANCQSNLEVGDPLSGTTYPVQLNGFKYHPQELAFFSWFYHQHPSIAVNGWYSDQDTFTSYAAPCS